MLALFSKLEPKDIFTLAVSIVALIVSGTNLLHTIRSKSREALKAARADLITTLEDLIEVSETREGLRKEAGSGWANRANESIRSILNQKRDLLLSQADYILSNYDLNISDIGFATVGAALSDAGRHAEALTFYQQGLKAATTQLARARARRAYGLTLIRAGKLESGRAEILTAVSEFAELERTPGIDPEAMRFDQAETVLRSLRAQIRTRDEKYVQEDYEQLAVLAANVHDAGWRTFLEDAMGELKDPTGGTTSTLETVGLQNSGRPCENSVRGIPARRTDR